MLNHATLSALPKTSGTVMSVAQHHSVELDLVTAVIMTTLVHKRLPSPMEVTHAGVAPRFAAVAHRQVSQAAQNQA